MTGNSIDGFHAHLELLRLPGRHRHLLDPVRALVLLRGRVDRDRARGHVPGRVLDRVPRRAPQVDAALPAAAAVLRLVRDPDPALAVHPRRPGDRARDAQGHPPSAGEPPRPVDPVRGDRRAHLRRAAVHGAADLRRAREHRPLASRGRRRPLREPGAAVPEGDPAALGARASTRGSCWSRSPTSATT